MKKGVLFASLAAMTLAGSSWAFQVLGAREVTLRSSLGQRVTRDIGTGRVQLVRELSRNRCFEGRSWGVRGNQLWVDDGCQAVFRVGVSGSTRSGSGDIWNRDGNRSRDWRDDDYGYGYPDDDDNWRRDGDRRPPGWDKGRKNGWGKGRGNSDRDRSGSWPDSREARSDRDRGISRRVIRLMSDYRNSARKTVRLFNAVDVRLLNELSGNCERNRTWGFTRNELWVRGGCSAEFGVREDRRNDRSGDWRNGDWRSEDGRNEDWRRTDSRDDVLGTLGRILGGGW